MSMAMKTGHTVCGDYPRRLFKAFDKPKYRDEFLSGSFRMGSISQYRDIEDGRRKDAMEGLFEYSFPDEKVQTFHHMCNPNETYVTEEPGLMQAEDSVGNPAYLFCTSTDSVDTQFLKKEYGDYVVEINDPKALAYDLNDYLVDGKHKIICGIWGSPVTYCMGTTRESRLEIKESIRLCYVQKPAHFKNDFEFRFIARFECAEKQQDYLNINLGKSLTYARPV